MYVICFMTKHNVRQKNNEGSANEIFGCLTGFANITECLLFYKYNLLHFLFGLYFKIVGHNTQ